MQHSSKKRRIDSPEDDWGNDFTAEDFDLLQSQVENVISFAPPPPPPPRIPSPERNDGLLLQTLQNEHLEQKGQISMLRLNLEQKSRELENERLQKKKQIDECLKVHHQKEQDLCVNIDRLESDIKFKQLELHKAQDKIKHLEQKIRQAVPMDSPRPKQIRNQSPVKAPLNVFVTRNFPNSSPTAKMDSTTQTTEMKEPDSFKPEFLLSPNAMLYNKFLGSVYCSSSRQNNSSINTLKVTTPCKSFDYEDQMKFSRVNCTLQDLFIHFHVAHFQNVTPHTACYCSNVTDTEFTNEADFFKTIELNLKAYVNFLAETSQAASESGNSCTDSPLKEPVSADASDISTNCRWSLLTKNTAVYLHDLCKLLTGSNVARNLFMKPLKNRGEMQSNELIYLVANCTMPVTVHGEVINKIVVDWSVTALTIILSYCGSCCHHFFSNFVPQLKLKELVDGSCSIETAYLTIHFLTLCIGIKAVFEHQSDSCMLRSVEKLLTSCFLTNNSTVSTQLKQLVTNITNWLTGFIATHGVNSLFNERCRCLPKVLKLILTGFLDRDFLEEVLIVKLFTFLQLLYRNLGSAKWYEFRARMVDSFLLTVNKIEHCELCTLPQVRNIIIELLENERCVQEPDEPTPMEI